MNLWGLGDITTELPTAERGGQDDDV